MKNIVVFPAHGWVFCESWWPIERDDVSSAEDAIKVTFPARKQIPSIALLGLFGIAFVVLGIVKFYPAWLAIVGGVEFLVFVAIGVVGVIRGASLPPALHLDPAGVSLRGGARVPWSQLQEIRILPMKPAWFVGSRRTMILAFIPRPGVLLPSPPAQRGRLQDGRRRLTRRVYGTTWTVPASLMSVSADQVVEAAARWGGLAVHREQLHPVRRWVTVIAIGVALGLIVGGARLAWRLLTVN